MKIVKKKKTCVTLESLQLGDVFSIEGNDILFMKTDACYSVRLDNGILISDNDFTLKEKKKVILVNCKLVVE